MSAAQPAGATAAAAAFTTLWTELAPIGRRPDGGYDRFAWSAPDLACRAWFVRQADARGLAVERDRNGNLWAWWGHDPGTVTDTAPAARTAQPRAGAIATGSHLDSVPRGGAFDGPLGVVSAFLALDWLRARHGDRPPRPVAICDFADEEGARFGVACLGSRLSTGVLEPGRARRLVDPDGVSLADAMHAAGADPDALGPDPARLAALGAFVELHVEQGRHLHSLGAPVGVATHIWPHGRWHLRFTGEANHGGTTDIGDRRDPMLPFAATVAAARAAAEAHGGLATVGRALVSPNATNAIASSVDAWLDARAPDDVALGSILADVRVRAGATSADHGVRLLLEEESSSAAVGFDDALRSRLEGALGGAPALGTGAGHDAGVLAAAVPTGMLFVRNPTGISHSPAEHASLEDCLAGVDALAAVLEELVWY